MKAYPIDSHVTFDSDGIPEYDRAITSEPLRKLIKSLFNTGIDPTVSTNLQVAADEGMNIIVRPGFAVVEGCMALEEDARVLAVQAASSDYDRIDTVVLRLNDNDPIRECDLYVVEGLPSATPVHPDLTRSGAIYEIGLADIFVGKNSTRILASKITDTRYDDTRCGIMSSISEIDTSTLNQQMVAWSAETQAEFEAWVEEIRNILDTNAAGHLQNQIDEINQHLTANNKKFIAGYVDGEYGFYIDGVFRPFSSGTTYLGEFSANATIDISELRGNPATSDFIFVINESASVSRDEANYQNYASGYSVFYPATFSINDDTLSLTVPIERVYNFGDDRVAGDHTDKLLKGRLYYKPSNVVGTYTSGQSIDVSAYHALTVSQFVVAEVQEKATANTGYTTYQNYGGVTAYYTKATLTLSGNTLTVTAPKTSASVGGEENIKYKVCYLGKSLKFSKQGF